MSENCNQSCSSCSEECAERKEQNTDFSEKLHDMNSVNKVIGVIRCQEKATVSEFGLFPVKSKTGIDIDSCKNTHRSKNISSLR